MGYPCPPSAASSGRPRPRSRGPQPRRPAPSSVTRRHSRRRTAISTSSRHSRASPSHLPRPRSRGARPNMRVVAAWLQRAAGPKQRRLRPRPAPADSALPAATATRPPHWSSPASAAAGSVPRHPHPLVPWAGWQPRSQHARTAAAAGVQSSATPHAGVGHRPGAQRARRRRRRHRRHHRPLSRCLPPRAGSKPDTELAKAAAHTHTNSCLCLQAWLCVCVTAHAHMQAQLFSLTSAPTHASGKDGTHPVHEVHPTSQLQKRAYSCSSNSALRQRWHQSQPHTVPIL